MGGHLEKGIPAEAPDAPAAAPDIPAKAPDLETAVRHLPDALEMITQATLESIASLLPEDGDLDDILEQHFAAVSNVCAQIQLSPEKLNPRWNKTYGTGGTCWQRALKDRRSRGGVPYYCPSGWVRFSLNVCADKDFDERFGDWGILYHGTKGRFVGAILATGFRASCGCYCGKDDEAIYLSESIEYCSHPRYASIEYNPETRQYIQVVLQCRVNPKGVWQIKPETLGARRHGLRVDPNIDNDKIEWLFKSNWKDPQTGYPYIKDCIVCTGIMMRITAEHPCDVKHWWAQDPSYREKWVLRVDPSHDMNHECWLAFSSTKMRTFSASGDPLGWEFGLGHVDEDIGCAWMAPIPFAQGGMRAAYFLHTSRGMFVVKPYLDHMLRHIKHGLGIREDEAIFKEVCTYLVSQQYAAMFNSKLPSRCKPQWEIHFIQPHVFFLDGKIYFGERYTKGKFVKWNSNVGDVNMTQDAVSANMHQVAGMFSHFTYQHSGGQIMVVDIQGWDLEGHNILFTDPQIHTKAFQRRTQDRKDQLLFRRFSIGNLGRTGMVKFFATHDCEVCGCGRLGLCKTQFAAKARKTSHNK